MSVTEIDFGRTRVRPTIYFRPDTGAQGTVLGDVPLSQAGFRNRNRPVGAARTLSNIILIRAVNAR